nr:hypothetical protein [Tanacetum cinerariifolium]
METCASLSQKVAELEQDKHTQALEILKLKKRVKKLEKKKRSKHSGLKRLRKIEAIDDDKDITLVDVEKDEEVVVMDAKPQGRINQEEINAASKGGNSSNDTKEMSEEDVQNMLEIVTVSEFKVEALQIKYPIIDWEIHSKGPRTYWKIIRVGGITEAYQSFEDMLKGFDREDLVALWSLVKENFSSVVPNVDKEKALWVKLKRLFELDADDVIWKLQRLMLLDEVDTAAEVLKKLL